MADQQFVNMKIVIGEKMMTKIIEEYTKMALEDLKEAEEAEFRDFTFTHDDFLDSLAMMHDPFWGNPLPPLPNPVPGADDLTPDLGDYVVCDDEPPPLPQPDFPDAPNFRIVDHEPLSRFIKVELKTTGEVRWLSQYEAYRDIREAFYDADPTFAPG